MVLYCVAPVYSASQKPFTPRDFRVMGVWGAGRNIAAKYQFRIEFYQLPEGITFSVEHGNAVYTRKDGSRTSLEALKLKPHKVLSFRNHVEIKPGARVVEKRIMVCTNMLTGYIPVTDKEREQLPRNGLPYFRWKNSAGKIEDFCGAVSMTGEVIWKLDYKQAVPDKLLQAVDLLPDGSKGLIYSGSLVPSDEGAEYVGNPRELYIWEYPDKLTTKDAAGLGLGANDFFIKFRGGEL